MSVGHFRNFNRYLMLSLGVHSLVTLGMLQVMSTAPADLAGPTPVRVAFTTPTLATLAPHLDREPQLPPTAHVIARPQTAAQPVAPAPAIVPLSAANAAWPAPATARAPLPHRAPPERRVPVQRLAAPAAQTPSIRAASSPPVSPQRTAPIATQAAGQSSRVAPASSTLASASALDGKRQSRLARRQSTASPSPQFIYQPKPHYPLIARRRGWQGTVMLTIEMLADGTVGIIKVARSSGYPPLDMAAQKAVRQWRHRPLHRNGSPITRQANLPIHFRLD